MFSARRKTLSTIVLLILVSTVLAACSGAVIDESSGAPAKFRDDHAYGAPRVPVDAIADAEAATDDSGHSDDEPADDDGHAVEGRKVEDEQVEEDHAEEMDAMASDVHEEAAEGHEDMATMHGIPPEAAAVENPVETDEASVARGAELFQANCTVCHGPTGVGDGPAAAGLEPKPANLSADHVQENTDGSLFYVISEGSAGTAMPSWKTNIGEENRWHLVNFVRTLPDAAGAGMAAMPAEQHADEAMPMAGDDGKAAEHAEETADMASMGAEGHEDMAAMHGIPPEAAAVENPVETDEASVARGAELFQANCTVCHGPTGVGDGPAAAGLEPKPANLSADHVQENTDGSLFYVISEGSAGTAMPSWKTNIGEEDRWHLVNFLRTMSGSE